ncbi:unnamed protein product [Owenia fusiformis]|uniref:Uncharacterized protein n=1 Tax=Owenia fusiformis TaxID=6347 RepID=A0A8J1UPI2_OWEFU|nr:unnamed protein product [Owenia fusiformis]
MLKIVFLIALQYLTWTDAQTMLCECALYQADGFLLHIEPQLYFLGQEDVVVGSECNSGDLTVCDQACRKYVIDETSAYTFDTFLPDVNNTAGDHMCSITGPIPSPGVPVHGFSRMKDCVILGIWGSDDWFTFEDAQFDLPNNLCCDSSNNQFYC